MLHSFEGIRSMQIVLYMMCTRFRSNLVLHFYFPCIQSAEMRGCASPARRSPGASSAAAPWTSPPHHPSASRTVPEKDGPLAAARVDDGVGEGRTAGDRARQAPEKEGPPATAHIEDGEDVHDEDKPPFFLLFRRPRTAQ